MTHCTQSNTPYSVQPDFLLPSGIQCLIADADISMVKLVEGINKRVNDPKTSHLPIVATLLLVPPDIDSEFMEKLKEVGGVNVMLSTPGVMTRQIFSRVLETMYQMSAIERTYKDLSKSTQMATFPYLPLFHSDIDVDNDGEADYGIDVNNDDDDDGDDDYDNEDNQNKKVTESESLTSWTYSSSMLPSFVKDRRDKALNERTGTFAPSIFVMLDYVSSLGTYYVHILVKYSCI